LPKAMYPQECVLGDAAASEPDPRSDAAASAASNTALFRREAWTALALGPAMTRDHDMGRPALVGGGLGPEPRQAHYRARSDRFAPGRPPRVSTLRPAGPSREPISSAPASLGLTQPNGVADTRCVSVVKLTLVSLLFPVQPLLLAGLMFAATATLTLRASAEPAANTATLTGWSS
jgi:hypothetical protein